MIAADADENVERELGTDPVLRIAADAVENVEGGSGMEILLRIDVKPVGDGNVVPVCVAKIVERISIVVRAEGPPPLTISGKDREAMR